MFTARVRRHVQLLRQLRQPTGRRSISATAPTVGTGLDAANFKTILGPRIKIQVTVNDQPLYYFAGDKAAGDTNGQGVGGKWFVVGADGKMMQYLILSAPSRRAWLSEPHGNDPSPPRHARLRAMRLAHVRERQRRRRSRWRLAAALDPGATTGSTSRSPVGGPLRPTRASPTTPSSTASRVTTLDDHLARGLRVEALADLVEGFAPRDDDDDAVLDADDLEFGPPILRPASFRDFYAFERHVGTMWERRGQEIPEAWFRLPIFYFSNVSELRGPGDAGLGAARLRRAGLRAGDRCADRHPGRDLTPERGEEAIGGYFVLNDWSARDLQRDETTVRLGPGQGQGLRGVHRPVARDADELADRRAPARPARTSR